MNFESGSIERQDGAEHLSDQVRTKFNTEAKAYVLEAHGKSPRLGRAINQIMIELGGAVREGNTTEQMQMEELLRQTVPSVNGDTEKMERMIGYLNQ